MTLMRTVVFRGFFEAQAEDGMMWWIDDRVSSTPSLLQGASLEVATALNKQTLVVSASIR